jgi:hypothetical protein
LKRLQEDECGGVKLQEARCDSVKLQEVVLQEAGGDGVNSRIMDVKR